MEGICLKIEQLFDLVSQKATITHWAILKIGLHYIRSTLVGCRSLCRFTSCSERVQTYQHLFPKSRDLLERCESQDASAVSRHGWKCASCPTLCSLEGHLQQAAQGHIHSYFECLQRWRPHKPSGPPVHWSAPPLQAFFLSRGSTVVTSVFTHNSHWREAENCADGKLSALMHTSWRNGIIIHSHTYWY